jgi:hypothetical protein
VDPLDSIREAQRQTEAAALALVDAVDDARDAGHTWTDIAGVFGVSRQAVQQRFGDPDPDPEQVAARAARRARQPRSKR